LRACLALVAGLAISALLLLAGISAGLDRALYDFRASLSAEIRSGKASPSSAALELIFIDQYSLGWVEENLGLVWPWPRELYGILAEYCSEAKVQVFDVLFTEASPYGPDDDTRCALAMDRAGNVVLAKPREGGSLSPSASGAAPASAAGLSGDLSALPVENVRFGSVTALLDGDGILRRYVVGNSLQPSLGLAALEQGREMENAPHRAEAWLRFIGSSPSLPARNAAEILASAISLREGREPQISPDYFKNKYLVLGFSAPGLLDRQAVPTDRAMPGAEIHATFLHNALSDQLLYPLAWGWELALVLLFSSTAALAATFLKKPLALMAAALLIIVIPLLVASAFYEAGLVTRAGQELAAASLSFIAGIVLSYVSEGKTRAFLKRSFSQYLSHEVIDELGKNPKLLTLGGEEREISVFFSDVEGFTALSESLSPERLAEFMNRYLSILTEAILAEGGTLDKYVGDAVVAFWNAPLPQTDHGVRAVRAALRAQNALKAATPAFEASGFPMPRTRIGIHTGRAIVGNLGSQWRFNYTALGDVVNTASRLEGANKQIGTWLLVSGDTVAQAGRSGDLEFRRLGEVLLQGKKKPVEVWEARSASIPVPGEEAPLGGAVLPWEGIKIISGKE